VRSGVQPLRGRRLVSMLMTIALATAAIAGLAGCGGGGGQTNASASLTAALNGQRARVNGIVTDLRTTLASAGPRPDALMANQFAALATRAEQEAAAIEQLGHPPGDNTRLRDIGSALVAVANGLGHLSTAATEHQVTTVRTEIRTLRADATAVGQTFTSVVRSLGPSG
jgi:hypothetical protein